MWPKHRRRRTACRAGFRSGEPPTDATREQLLLRDTVLRGEVRRLTERLARAEAAGGGSGDGAPNGPGTSFFDPSREEMQQMAARCELRFDVPSFEPGRDDLTDEAATGVGLTDEERASLQRVTKQEARSFLAELRRLHAEITGDEHAADDLSWSAIGMEIVHKAPSDEVAGAPRPRRRVGRTPLRRQLRRQLRS